MKDISDKVTTLRTALARSVLRVTDSTIATIKAGEIPKGDPLVIAKVAAVQAAKNTSMIIPYCHQIAIDYVGVEYELTKDSIVIDVTVKATHKTGVEMEAMTAASVAALTIYDMVKPLDDFAEIEKTILVSKKGGKSDYKPDASTKDIGAAVLVLSDRVSKGESEDRSGKIICEKLSSLGIARTEYIVLPDSEPELKETIEKLCKDDSINLILTTGGTGLSPRDITVETLTPIIERRLPGVEEAIRSFGQSRNRFAMLSRAVAGVCEETVIVSMPGSTGGVKDALAVLFPPVLHALGMLKGEGHESKKREKARAKG